MMGNMGNNVVGTLESSAMVGVVGGTANLEDLGDCSF